MTQHMFPIGVSDFARLIRHKNTDQQAYLFVDKTLMIKEFIDAGDEIALITRPRRFGKTLSLSMMQHFFPCVTHTYNRLTILFLIALITDILCFPSAILHS